jgi:hypothetical protein
MAPDDTHSTYNPLTNDDKELLLRHGHVPGELEPYEERELLADLWAEEDDGSDE